MVQLTPALTDFKGPTIFICYRRISVIANIEIKEKLFKGPKEIFCYRRISVTGGSVRAGFNCISTFLVTADVVPTVIDVEDFFPGASEINFMPESEANQFSFIEFCHFSLKPIKIVL